MPGGPYIEPNPPRALAERMRETLAPSPVAIEEFRGEVTIVLPADRLLEAARQLKEGAEAAFEMLTAVVALHFLEREFEHEVVYQLYSLSRNHRLRLKVQLRTGEDVPSLTSLWKGADWMEREQYDLVGVRFTGHPDLRRIIMPEDYPDHPLRKDFDVEGGPASIDVQGKPASPGFRDMEHA
jgi:NADH/F420H2 dehydrogenase subunit C